MRNSGKWVLGLLAGLSMVAGLSRPSVATMRPTGADEADSEGNVRAHVTLVGDVLVKTDGHGRLVVIVDEARAGAPADGVADRLFILESEQPLAEQIERRLFLASVVFRGRSLYVSAPGTSFTVDGAILSRQDHRRSISEEGIVLHDGTALQSRAIGRDRVSVEAVNTDAMVTTVDGTGPVSAASEGCQSGGPGAAQCSKGCNFSSASISRGDQCGVECREGYYACCSCNWLYVASCMCRAESPLDWGTPKIGVDRH